MRTLFRSLSEKKLGLSKLSTQAKWNPPHQKCKEGAGVQDDIAT